VREGKIEERKGTERRSSKTIKAEISIATTLSMAEKARNVFSADNNRARSNGRSRKDKYSSG